MAVLIVSGCKGEDRPNVDVIGGAGNVSVSASGVGPSEGGGAQASPVGTVGAYAPASDVGSYLALALDLRDIRAALSPAQGTPDWAGAQAIYLRGKNQRLPDGSIRPLTPGPNESIEADALIREGLAGTVRAAGLPDPARKAVIENALLMLVHGRAMQELETARSRVESGAANPGAPVDIAWAIITGPTEDGRRPHSLLAFGAEQEKEFTLEGKLSVPLEATLAAALAAAQQSDKSTFNRAHAEAKGYLNAIFYLSVLRSAKVLDADTTFAARQAHLAEGRTLWQTIRATAAGGSAGAARDIDGAFNADPATPWTTADTAKVYAWVNDPDVLMALGIPVSLRVTTPPAR